MFQPTFELSNEIDYQLLNKPRLVPSGWFDHRLAYRNDVFNTLFDKAVFYDKTEMAIGMTKLSFSGWKEGLLKTKNPAYKDILKAFYEEHKDYSENYALYLLKVSPNEVSDYANKFYYSASEDTLDTPDGFFDDDSDS